MCNVERIDEWDLYKIEINLAHVKHCGFTCGFFFNVISIQHLEEEFFHTPRQFKEYLADRIRR